MNSSLATIEENEIGLTKWFLEKLQKMCRAVSTTFISYTYFALNMLEARAEMSSFRFQNYRDMLNETLGIRCAKAGDSRSPLFLFCRA